MTEREDLKKKRQDEISNFIKEWKGLHAFHMELRSIISYMNNIYNYITLKVIEQQRRKVDLPATFSLIVWSSGQFITVKKV